MIVLDASIAIELLLNSAVGLRARSRIGGDGGPVHVPHLIDLEVAHALRRYLLANRIATERCREGLVQFLRLPLLRHAHDGFLLRIWEMRHTVTAYDAAYLALAESLGAPLLTTDAALAERGEHFAHVEVLR